MSLDDEGSDGRVTGLSTGPSPDPVRVLVVVGESKRGVAVRTALTETTAPLAVIVETDGERVLERIDTGRVECLVCTGRSASRDGLSLLEAVRERDRRLPFVLLDDGGRVSPSAAIEAGATDCVRTPITDEDAPVVACRLRNYGERYRTERRLENAVSVLDRVTEIADTADFVDIEPGSIGSLDAPFSPTEAERFDDVDGACGPYDVDGADRTDDPDDTTSTRVSEDAPSMPPSVVKRVLDRYDEDQASSGDRTGRTTSDRDAADAPATSRPRHETTERLTDTGGWELDLRTEALRWTAGARRIHGVDPDYEPTIDAAMNWYHPLDRVRIETALVAAIEDGSEIDETARLVAADGTERWVRLRGKTHRENGEPALLRGSIADVTARERQARAARTTDAKLQALSAAFPDVAAVLDEDGRCLDVYVGPASESLLVDDPDALVGDHVDEILPPAQASLFTDAIADALATERVRTVEYRLDVPAGDRWFECRVAPLDERLDGRRAVGVVVRDVTVHRETERELREKEAHLTQAQAVADLGSWRIELPKLDIRWSDEVYRLFGFDTDEPVTGERYATRIHPEDRDRIEREWDAALDGAPFDLEHRIVVDGETRWLRAKAEFEFDDDGAPERATGIVQDITDLKRHEQRLEFQNQQIEVFNRIIRHDLRNQLNIVAGYASLLTERIEDAADDDTTDDDTTDEDAIAAGIDEAAAELLSVGDEIREVNRLLNAGTDRCPIGLRVLLDDVLDSIRAAYPDEPFECELTIADSLWVFERDGLKIAFENVIENAIEHIDGPRPRIEITAEECPDGDYVAVQIADNGPGIPESEREILTGVRERTQLEHTSGLGLWTVYWIVSTVGGKLTFDTTEDDDRQVEGTVVTITLPCATAPEQSLWA